MRSDPISKSGGLLVWAVTALLPVLAFSALPLRSSSGFHVGAFVLPLLWMFIMAATAPWVWPLLSHSPSAHDVAQIPAPKLDHLGPELRVDIAHLIQGARTVRESIGHDSDDALRLLWDWTHLLDAAPLVVQLYLDRLRDTLEPVRASLRAEPDVMTTPQWRDQVRDLLAEFERAVTTGSTTVGYRTPRAMT